MKRVYYLLVTLLVISLATGNTMAQSTNEGTTLTKKEAKKAKREAEKKFEEAKDMYKFQQAVQALNSKSFVVQVNQLIYPKGRTQFVTSQTNFIYMNDDEAVVQIATTSFAPGPNGVGGITVEGRPSDIKMQTDKKGNVYYEFSVQGIAISATVTIHMTQGTNNVNVTVYPNFNSNKLTMSGTLVPYDSALIFQGQTI